MFFQCSGFFPPIFIQQKQKTVEFFNSVLWILYNDFTNFNFSGQEIWFCYFSSSYFFHNLPSPLIICFILTLPLLILWRGEGGRGASNCVFWKQSPRFQFITTSPKLRNWLKMPNPLIITTPLTIVTPPTILNVGPGTLCMEKRY